MTTLLLVFVCLQVVTAADSVELSGTCPGHGKVGLSHVLHSGPTPKNRQPPDTSVPKICAVHTQGSSVQMAAEPQPLAALVFGKPGR